MPAAKGNSTHELDDELLVRYSVHLSDPDNPDYDGRRLSPGEIEFVAAHLENCSPCSERLEQLRDEFREVEQYLDQAGFPDVAKTGVTAQGPAAPAHSARNGESQDARTFWRRAIAAAAVLIVLAAGWTILGPVDDSVKLAQIEPAEISTGVRSEEPELLARGKFALQQGRTEAAIASFTQFIDENGTDSLAYYGRFLLGVSHLLQAGNGLPGPLAGYDTGAVDRALGSLGVALKGSDNTGIAEDCHWYIGKAHIMKSEWRQAEENILRVIEIRGRRLDQAEQLAAAIGRILERD